MSGHPASPRTRGFTLIELMIVVGILGILAGRTNGKRSGEHRSFGGNEAWTDYTVEAKANLLHGKGYGIEKTVRIDVKGDTFTAYVNGEKVLSGSDSTFTQGGIGLRTWGKSAVEFDDVKVTAD